MNGSGGIAVAGMEEEYATEMWLENPSAFWLHPLGPLSDVTPSQYKRRTPARKSYWVDRH